MTFSEPFMLFPNSAFGAFTYSIRAVNAVNQYSWEPAHCRVRQADSPCSFRKHNHVNSFKRSLRPKLRAVASGQVRERPRYRWRDPPRYLSRSPSLARGSLPQLPLHRDRKSECDSQSKRLS